MGDSERKDPGIGASDEEVGEFLYHLGGAVSDLFGRRDDWDEGTDRLTGGAPDAAVGTALHKGVLAAMDAAEKRRAFREYHERAADEQPGAEASAPLVDVSRIENEAGETTGLHVIHSSPEARVYAGEDHVLTITSDPRSGAEYQQTVGVPFGAFQVEHLDRENVTEFKIRREDQSAESRETLVEEIVLEQPGRAILAGIEADAEAGYENLHLLTAELLTRDPTWAPGNAAGAVEGAIGRVGLEALAARYVAEHDGAGLVDLEDDGVREQLVDGAEPEDLIEEVDDAPDETEGKEDAEDEPAE